MSALFNRFGRLGLLLVFGVGSFLVVYFYFYGVGGYDAPPPTVLPIEGITAPSSELRLFDESPLIQKGTLLIDGIHGNDFTKSELAALISRVNGRGYEV